ncbi:MAG: acyl carrier protein [Okeania sp. SIO3B5]|uniref:acyl carrier protein n=1 Tax=Cyanophyceae TaxID=3028117 RepID=UPI0013FFA6EA|nr:MULTISPECIES: acyl carrier protein [Oscillatoriaceae]NEO53137.1 acyl carrier protein [Okeania sp. SIO3B5]NEO78390.1 acyl carrier protein [Moorena sp. SIO4G3]
MNKEQIFNIIKRYTCEIAPELEKVPIAPTDSLKNLGIDSVNRAEIIMMVMEELSLNIPRIELAGSKNIGELADIFAEKLEKVNHGN